MSTPTVRRGLLVGDRFVTQIEHQAGLVAGDQLNEAGFRVAGLDRNPQIESPNFLSTPEKYGSNGHIAFGPQGSNRPLDNGRVMLTVD